MKIRGRGRKEEEEEQPVEQVAEPPPSKAKKRVKATKKPPKDNGQDGSDPFAGVAVVEDESGLDGVFKEKGGSHQVTMSDDAARSLQTFLLSSPTDKELPERSVIDRMSYAPMVMATTMGKWSKEDRRDPETGEVKSLLQTYIDDMLRMSRSVDGRWIKTGLEIGKTKTEETAQGDVWQQ